jgi:penicillin G amidase
VKYLDDFAPGNPDLSLAAGIDSALLSADILALYNAFRAPVRFQPEDIVASARGSRAARGEPETAFASMFGSMFGSVEPDAQSPDAHSQRTTARENAMLSDPLWSHAELDIGSNNWAVSGRLSESGFPILANDPHRTQAAPSLRYWVHLQAPGWNVIGGGEPVLPGISIGHNEHGAWGLTIFATDGEDLVVYDTDPANPNQYRFQNRWDVMRTIVDTIPVKGRAPQIVTHRYTRHGPVVYRDTVRHRAFAVRAAWMEIGGAPYLASLRMDQARTWEEFREANRYAHIPGENMVWADRSGTIGWQAVGIAPRRRNFSGLVPVPGDGRENARYEWDGFLDILDKPHVSNPEKGFIATANNDLIPRDYPFMDAVGYVWSDPYRFARISEVLGSGTLHSVSDMMQLQTDELSLPARQLVPLLRELRAPTPRLDSLRVRLLAWDHVLDRESVEAGVYAEWESQLRAMVYRAVVRPAERSFVRSVPLRNVVRWLVIPPAEFGASPMAARDTMLLDALAAADAELRGRFGVRIDDWQYGRPGYKHALIRHPLSAAVDSVTRARLDVGPMPRGGYAVTVNATGNGDNQTSGASFRLIVDLADWDRAVGMNSPGQSGDPASPHYRDLFVPWSRDQFFPVVFSTSQVEQATESIVRLRAGARR